MKRASDTVGWLVGISVGVVAAVMVVVAGGAVSAPPATAQEAQLTMTATPTGELAITPTQVVLRVVTDVVTGEFTVLNQTGTSLYVTITATVDKGELASRLSANIIVNDESVFDGPVANLPQGTEPFVIESGETQTIVATFRVLDIECLYCSSRVELQFETSTSEVQP